MERDAPLDEDLSTIASAIANNSRRKPAEAIERLSKSDDDRALEALIDAFEWARLSGCEPAKSALTRSAHPNVAVQVAARLEDWWAEERLTHSRLCVAHGGKLLGQLGDPRALSAVIALCERAASHPVSLRGLLIARVGMGDAHAQRGVREQYLSGRSGQGTDGYAKDMLGVVPPAAYYDTFAPIVRAYQSGDDAVASAAARVALQVGERPSRVEKGKRVDLPTPELDPRWFELGLELHDHRPRPRLRPFAPRLLDVAHPDREARLAERRAANDAVSPYSDLPDGWRERRQRSDWWTSERNGITWLHANRLKLAECEALFDSLGEERMRGIRGISLSGRRFAPEAFDKVAGWERLAHFTHIDLSYTWPKARAFRTLVNSPHLAGATHLDVRGVDAKAPPFALLTRGDALPALDTLLVAGGGDRMPSVGLASLLELADGPRRLKRLTLSAFQFRESMAPFLESEFARTLESLTIGSRSQLGERGAELIGALSSPETQIRRLALPHCFRNRAAGDWNRLGPGELPHLEALDLRGAQAEHHSELAAAWFLPELAELRLGEAVIGDGFGSLLERACPVLERLSLRDATGLDAHVMRMLASSDLASSLRWLDVGGATDLRTEIIDELDAHVASAMRAAGWPG